MIELAFFTICKMLVVIEDIIVSAIYKNYYFVLDGLNAQKINHCDVCPHRLAKVYCDSINKSICILCRERYRRYLSKYKVALVYAQFVLKNTMNDDVAKLILNMRLLL